MADGEPTGGSAAPSLHPFPFRADTVDSFPPAFLAWLESNGIHPETSLSQSKVTRTTA